jgi:alpha-beta hydrolase superfamily lysophospholipase
VPRRRVVTAARPAEIDELDGLAYSLWLPETNRSVRGGVVILHGAGSCKENHHDFARALLAVGLASIALDLRGHGASAGPLDGRVLDDIAAIAAYLRGSLGGAGAPIVLRGSSMGGYLALLAAPVIDAAAVVAICPAGAAGLRRGLADGRFSFEADVAALDAFLASHELQATVAGLRMPVLLLHAEGDEQVPVEHSRELAAQLRALGSRLITVPGGHHRSIQHDPELQAVSLRFIERAVRESVAAEGAAGG